MEGLLKVEFDIVLDKSMRITSIHAHRLRTVVYHNLDFTQHIQSYFCSKTLHLI